MSKVTILTSVHSAFDVRIFHKQAKSLAKAGYEVTLIAQHEKSESIDRIRLIGLPRPANRLHRITIFSFKIIIQAIKQKASIYHFHDPELLIFVGILKIFTNAKIIFDVHENVKKQILNKTWIPYLFRKIVSFIYLLIELIALKFIDYIIIAEDSYIENYSNFGNVIAVRNYPLIEHTDIDKANLSDLKAKPTVLIYIGGISRIRGALEMVEAVNNLVLSGIEDTHLRLIGPIAPDIKDDLYNSIKKYGLDFYISVLGVINHKNIFDELAKADIGLAILHPDPNYIESLPTKLFEYMSMALPVIASNFPMWKEIVEKEHCGLAVDPLNASEIANSIKYLMAKPELRQKMGENGRKAVLEKYNWAKESEKLLNLYRSLIKV